MGLPDAYGRGRIIGDYRHVALDGVDRLASSAAFAASLGNVERVEVLPFHQMGRYKWERLKRDYTLKDTAPPTPEEVEKACAVWRAAGLNAN